MPGEKDNICNLPRRLTIQVHVSKDTGNHYIHFIEWTGITRGNEGYWTDRKISEEDYKWLLKLCYPFLDGEQRTIRCQDEYNPATDEYERDVYKDDTYCIDCDVGCPYRLSLEEWYENQSEYDKEMGKRFADNLNRILEKSDRRRENRR